MHVMKNKNLSPQLETALRRLSVAYSFNIVALKLIITNAPHSCITQSVMHRVLLYCLTQLLPARCAARLCSKESLRKIIYIYIYIWFNVLKMKTVFSRSFYFTRRHNKERKIKFRKSFY
jgi:hypothetical protein